MDTLASATADSEGMTPELISARMERLPFSHYHVRILSIVGTCSFFDAFDSLMISYVLPVLVVAWKFSPSHTGLMISGAYVGQVLGAWGFACASERAGRVKALQWSVGLLAVMAGLCALARSFPILLALRFIQGLGLGGEVPVGAAYISEFTNARTRGRVVFGLQVFYAFAVLVTAIIGAYVVPIWGWRAMFLLGLFPALLAIALRRIVPESPRWLAQHVSLEAAERTVGEIERAVIASGTAKLPPVANIVPPIQEKKARISELFDRTYRWRTFSVWAMCFCYASISTAMNAWLPTIFRTIYHVQLTNALYMTIAPTAGSFLGVVVGLFFIDSIGRRKCFLFSFAVGSIPFLILGLGLAPESATQVMILASLGNFLLGWLIPGFYVYMPEIYPTRMRALGAGVGSSWFRIGAIVSPMIIAVLVANASVSAVFLFFGCMALFGVAVTYFFVIETSGRVLEDISQ
ncbi:MAG TPA: MFS transporter [Xanthobacteraceae bacterium]